MRPLFLRARRAGVLVGVLALGVLGARGGPVTGPARHLAHQAKEKAHTFQGSTSCARCHADPFGEPTDLVKLKEFSIWQTKDVHSLAYVSLLGARARRMGRVLGADATKPEAGCLGCHSNDTRKPGGEPSEFATQLLTAGVGCESCHGAASDWLGPHWQAGWRDLTSEQKEEKGLRNLRSLGVQSAVCLSCHLGNADGKVVTHAMFAAGHPPLQSINVAEFAENEPRHWYHLKNTPWLNKGASEKQRKNFDFDRAEFRQTRLALVGALAGLRDSANLLKERATATADSSSGRWPELARSGDAAKADASETLSENWPELAMTHLDCAACHHDLRVPSARQARGYRGIPGRPTPPEWLRVLLPVAVGRAGGGLSPTLNDFHRAVTLVPFGDPADIRRAAPPLAEWADSVMTRLERQPLDEAAVEGILAALCGAGDRLGDYDSARQVVSVIDVIFRELPESPSREAAAPVLARLKQGLNLERGPLHLEREQFLQRLIVETARAERARAGVEPAKDGNVYSAELLRTAVSRGGLGGALTAEPALRTLSEVSEKVLAQAEERSAGFDLREVQEGLKAIRDRLPRR